MLLVNVWICLMSFNNPKICTKTRLITKFVAQELNHKLLISPLTPNLHLSPPPPCMAGNFRQRKISSKATVRQFVRIFFVKRRSSITRFAYRAYLQVTFMNISDPTLVVLWKKLVRNLILLKSCFDESNEIKFLTKISCYTVYQMAVSLVFFGQLMMTLSVKTFAFTVFSVIWNKIILLWLTVSELKGSPRTVTCGSLGRAFARQGAVAKVRRSLWNEERSFGGRGSRPFSQSKLQKKWAARRPRALRSAGPCCKSTWGRSSGARAYVAKGCGEQVHRMRTKKSRLWRSSRKPPKCGWYLSRFTIDAESKTCFPCPAHQRYHALATAAPVGQISKPPLLPSFFLTRRHQACRSASPLLPAVQSGQRHCDIRSMRQQFIPPRRTWVWTRSDCSPTTCTPPAVHDSAGKISTLLLDVKHTRTQYDSLTTQGNYLRSRDRLYRK